MPLIRHVQRRYPSISCGVWDFYDRVISPPLLVPKTVFRLASLAQHKYRRKILSLSISLLVDPTKGQGQMKCRYGGIRLWAGIRPQVGVGGLIPILRVESNCWWGFASSREVWGSLVVYSISRTALTTHPARLHAPISSIPHPSPSLSSLHQNSSLQAPPPLLMPQQLLLAHPPNPMQHHRDRAVDQVIVQRVRVSHLELQKPSSDILSSLEKLSGNTSNDWWPWTDQLRS